MFNIHPSAWIFLFLWLKVFRYLEKKWKIACEQRSNSIGVLIESQLDRTIVWASKTTGFSNFQRELLQEIQRIGVLSKLRQWNSCCSHAIFYFFSKYSMTFNSYKLKFKIPHNLLNRQMILLKEFGNIIGLHLQTVAIGCPAGSKDEIADAFSI